MNDPPHFSAPGSTRSSLLDRVRLRDPAAWEQLVKLYGPLVQFWCRSYELSIQDVEDLFQEVFLRVARGFAEFRHDQPNASFRGWLFIITRNLVIDHFRNREGATLAQGGSDVLRLLHEVPFPLREPEEDARDADQLLGRALNLIRGKVKEKTWQAFWLVVAEEMAPEEAARTLSMSVDSVYKARYRITRKLQEEFGSLLD